MKNFNLPIGCFTLDPLSWGQVIDKYYFYGLAPFTVDNKDIILYRRVIVTNNDGYLYLVTSYLPELEYYFNYANHYASVYLNGVLIS